MSTWPLVETSHPSSLSGLLFPEQPGHSLKLFELFLFPSEEARCPIHWQGVPGQGCWGGISGRACPYFYLVDLVGLKPHAVAA
jgi:hypothetical protein